MRATPAAKHCVRFRVHGTRRANAAGPLFGAAPLSGGRCGYTRSPQVSAAQGSRVSGRPRVAVPRPKTAMHKGSRAAIIAYLNGVEIGRRGAGQEGDEYGHDAWAASKSPGSAGPRLAAPRVVWVDPKHLETDENCLAIQGLSAHNPNRNTVH